MTEKGAPSSFPRGHIPVGWQVELYILPYLTNESDVERRMVYYVNLKTHKAQWTPPTSPAHSRSGTPEPPSQQHQSQSRDYAEETYPTDQRKPTTAAKINNFITGIEQNYKSGRRGYGNDPYGNDPSQQQGFGYRGHRRQRRGLIHSVIGGVAGALQGNQNPAVESSAGMRPQQASGSGGGHVTVGSGYAQGSGRQGGGYTQGSGYSQGDSYPQETGVQPVEYVTEQGVDLEQHTPPPYEPRHRP
jgi:hypothetical protein